MHSTAQRNHDGLKAMGRSVLASGELGQHNGLPCTIIVSTTLQELESAAGVAVTGGGTLVPMSDGIRLASNSHHYLVIYDKHTEEPLYLHRSKRRASAGQRIVLHAQDRRCTFPGCTVAGYGCQVHHAEWTGPNADKPTSPTRPWLADHTTAWSNRSHDDGTANAPDRLALRLTTPRCSPPRRPSARLPAGLAWGPAPAGKPVGRRPRPSSSHNPVGYRCRYGATLRIDCYPNNFTTLVLAWRATGSGSGFSISCSGM
jgi:hypothetical protein